MAELQLEARKETGGSLEGTWEWRVGGHREELHVCWILLVPPEHVVQCLAYQPLADLATTRCEGVTGSLLAPSTRPWLESSTVTPLAEGWLATVAVLLDRSTTRGRVVSPCPQKLQQESQNNISGGVVLSYARPSPAPTQPPEVSSSRT